MKKLILLLSIAVIIASCKSNTLKELSEEIETPPSSNILANANLVDGTHPTRGTAKLLQTENGVKLVFENFFTTNGPDLRVYLTKTNQRTSDFIEIGPLKALSGNFSYDISSSINTAEYSHVQVYCVRFPQVTGWGLFARQ